MVSLPFQVVTATLCVSSPPGVVAVSWYPPNTKDDNGEPTDDIVPLLLNVAHKYHIKVGAIPVRSSTGACARLDNRNLDRLC